MSCFFFFLNYHDAFQNYTIWERKKMEILLIKAGCQSLRNMYVLARVYKDCVFWCDCTPMKSKIYQPGDSYLPISQYVQPTVT